MKNATPMIATDVPNITLSFLSRNWAVDEDVDVEVACALALLVAVTLPRSVLSIAQIFLIPLTTAGRSGQIITSSWPVFTKLEPSKWNI